VEFSSAVQPRGHRGHGGERISGAPFNGTSSSFEQGHRVTAVVHAIVLITAEPARIAALASDIADLDGVSAAYSVAGDEDIVVVIRVSDHESLADLVTGSIAAQPGVLRTRTLIAFRVYSQADRESI
jgi:DNA-binding Lrp family transcriptional regulator